MIYKPNSNIPYVINDEMLLCHCSFTMTIEIMETNAKSKNMWISDRLYGRSCVDNYIQYIEASVVL